MRRRAAVLRLDVLLLIVLTSLSCAGGQRVHISTAQGFGPRQAGVVSANNRWGWPSGRLARHKPKGWVLVVHGGGWVRVGARYVDTVNAVRFNTMGWATYSIDYRAAGDAFWDTLAAYDHLRAVVGTRAPVCAWGASVGGHLVMLLGAVRPSLDCIISEGGITDLTTLASQPAFTSPGSAPSVRVPRRVVIGGALPAFSRSGLWDWSPVRVARWETAPMLLAGSSFDAVIPDRQQMAEFKRARPQTQTLLLPGADASNGGVPFTHADITAAARRRYDQAVAALLAQGLAHAQARAAR